MNNYSPNKKFWITGKFFPLNGVFRLLEDFFGWGSRLMTKASTLVPAVHYKSSLLRSSGLSIPIRQPFGESFSNRQ